MAILTSGLRRAALLALLLAGPATLAGCYNLFKPATPTPPASGGTTLKRDYSDPDQTLGTMALAMSYKNQSDAWILGFANGSSDNATAEFDFDPSVLKDLNVTDPAWDLSKEASFYTSMCAHNSQPYAMVWHAYDPGGNDETDTAAGTAYRPRTYRLFTVDSNGDTTGFVARGIALLHFKRVSATRWVIVQWVDKVDTEADPNDLEQVCFSRRRLSPS